MATSGTELLLLAFTWRWR